MRVESLLYLTLALLAQHSLAGLQTQMSSKAINNKVCEAGGRQMANPSLCTPRYVIPASIRETMVRNGISNDASKELDAWFHAHPHHIFYDVNWKNIDLSQGPEQFILSDASDALREDLRKEHERLLAVDKSRFRSEAAYMAFKERGPPTGWEGIRDEKGNLITLAQFKEMHNIK